jgi:hypothetical protein
MPPLFASTAVMTRNDIRDRGFLVGWGWPASIVVHSLIAALLIFGLPPSLSQPQQEPPIKVEIVPPPKPVEQARADPPPPSERAEEPKAEMPPEAKVEKTAKSDDAAREAPIAAVRPVFKFGEKDAGPRQSADGNSARDGSAQAAAAPKPDKQPLAGLPELAAAGAEGQVPEPGAPGTTAPKPVDAARFQERAPKLEAAKRLYSQAATGDPAATTAMAGVPRGVRAGRLCVTELREQLMHALPPFFPDLLPFQGLEDGEVIEVPGTAFRAERLWYDLSFRCEVDAGATKVVAFAFQVGGPVPHGEWKRRGLPWD